MKIKFKLIVIFILSAIILLAPFFSFLIKKLESESLRFTITQNRTNCRIFSKSVLNILMMNGGDMHASSVDIKDMTSMLEPLIDGGLVYADAILLSPDHTKNGIILSSLIDPDSSAAANYHQTRVSSGDILNLLEINNSYREIELDQPYLEFAAAGSLPGQKPFCITRIVISKSRALKQITSLKLYFEIALVALIFAIIVFAFIFGEYISRPITVLTEGVKKIESGDYTQKVKINQKDEIGTLAATFNKMTTMIKLKITELEDANIELTRMDRLKDEFLANTSHELKTPVHGILGLTESLIDGSAGTLNENTKQILSMILQSSRRLAKIVNDIIDFTKLKSSDIKLKKSSVDLGTITDTIVAIVKPAISDKDVTITNEIPSGIFFVLADEERLKQILLNIIENAVKFTEKGEINITAVNTQNGECRVTVTDTGIGISDNEKEFIFDSFYQSDGSSTRKYSGTGLGLAITKDLVDLHGGSIGFSSDKGEGTSFFFTIRSSEKPQSIAEPEIIDRYRELEPGFKLITGYDKVSETGSRIMIVDDDIINLQLLLNQLTKEGFTVASFTGGEKALASIESGEKYDVILLDVMMPVISGYEVCKKIREKFTSHELPVIMLTAKNTNQDIITGINLGANDYITKPFDRDVLLTRVRSYVSLKKAVEEQTKFIEIKQELAIARKIQLAILPGTLPEIPGVALSARYEPMREVGGDFYDFLEIDDKHLGILIADVTGHGVPAALISSMIKVSFKMSMEAADNPAILLEKINAALYSHIYGRFVSAFYLYIDLEKMTVTYSNAAHWPMYIHNRTSGDLTDHTVKGKLIGISREQNFINKTIGISKGERIVLYTDGVIEQRNMYKEMIGEENLQNIIIAGKSTPPGELISEIYNSVYDWSENLNEAELEDDVTMIVIDFN